MRCGDTVRAKKTGMVLELAYEDNGRAIWCGWPDGTIDTEELELVEACSDDEHAKSVARWLDADRSIHGDHRRSMIEQLYRPEQYRRRVESMALDEMDSAISRLRYCAVPESALAPVVTFVAARRAAEEEAGK